MTDDKRTEIALFRFSIISSLIHLDYCQDRNKIIEQLTEKTYEIPHSQKNKLHKKTIIKYLKLYKEKGFEGLKPKQRNDNYSVRSIPEEVLEKLIKLKKENPERSVVQVITHFKLIEGNSDYQIARRTLSRIFKNLGLNEKSIKPKKIYRSFEMEHINELWEADIMDGLFIKAENKMTYLFAFIDDHSRLLTHAQFYYDEKLPRLEDCLKKAILKRGIPKAIYTDNGKVFISNHFKRICAELGIKLIHHLPYSPQSKAKIERAFYTFQKKFLIEARGANITSIAKLNSYFHAWLSICYQRVIHSVTGQTPLDRFTDGMKKTVVRKVESLEDITEIFLYRQERKVNKALGTVSIYKNIYRLNEVSLLGKTVSVRYDPFDLSKVYIYDLEGAFKLVAYPKSLKDKASPQIPEENNKSDNEIKKSSIDFFSRLKQKEIEIQKKESGFTDFTKLNKGEEEND